MVVGKELFAVELEVVPEFAPESGAGISSGIALERDIGDCAALDD